MASDRTAISLTTSVVRYLATGDRTCSSLSVDGSPSIAAETSPLAPYCLHEFGQAIDLLARELGAAGHAEALDHAAGLDDGLEDAELGARREVGEVLQLEAEAQVGLVGAEARDHLVVVEARERRGRLQLGAQRRERAR